MTETQVVEYNVTDAGIAEMGKMYLDLTITDLDDSEQYDAVHKAHMTVRGKRIEVDKKRKELKADALAWGKKVQSEANRIFALIEPIESHLKAEKQKVNDEKERIENERIAGIVKKMSDLRGMSTDATLISAEGLKTIIADIDAIKIEPEEYFEFTTEANQLKQEKMIDACNALELRERLDQEEAERKAEAERLEAERAELEKAKAMQAERELEEKRQRDIEAVKVKAEQDRIAAEQKAAQDKIDEANRKIQAEKDALEAEKRKAEEAKRLEEAKIEAAEHARLAEIERHKQAELDRLEREKKAKEAAIREEMLKPDRDKLMAFSQFLAEGVTYPNVNDETAQVVLDNVYERLQDTAAYILKGAESL